MLKITRNIGLLAILASGAMLWTAQANALAPLPSQVLPVVANFQPVNNSLPKADPRRYSPPAAMYQNHARDYSRMMYYYGNSQTGLKPAQAQQLVGEIKKNVELSSKELQSILAAHPKDARVKELVDKIEKHHANAKAHCNAIEAEAKGDKVETVKVCDCCVDIDGELKAAQADTDALLQYLKLDNVPTMRKSTDKPVAK